MLYTMVHFKLTFKKIPISFFCCLLMTVLVDQKLRATNYYVNDADPSLTNDLWCQAPGAAFHAVNQDGRSVNKPVTKLKSLLSYYAGVFAFGDTIFIDAGNYTYTGTADNNMSSPPNGVVIMGASYGTTVITNSCADCYFMYIDDNNTKLERLTLTNYNDQTGGHGQALGILTNVSGVFINNVVINESSTSSSGSDFPIKVESGASVTFDGGGSTCNSWDAGGGIHVLGATTVVRIHNYQFIGGYNLFASPSSSGLWVQNGNVTVTNSLFDGNETDASTYSGSHLSVTNGNVTVLDCMFTNSKTYYTGAASVVGGAICIMAGNVRIARSKILNHSSTGGGGTSYGGGIGVKGGTVTIDSCIFSNNFGHATRGKDFYNNGGTVTIRDCTFGTATNQIGCNAGTTSITFSGSPSSNTSYRTGLSLTVNAPRFSPNPITPTYSGTCASGVLLPVVLASISAQCQGDFTDLEFSTLSERDNDYFIIERAAEDFKFEEIGRLEAVGNSSEIRDYSFRDNIPQIGGTFYRLSQVDRNGLKKQIETFYFEKQCSQNQLTAFYNSDNETITINLDEKSSSRFTVQVLNETGQLVMEQCVFTNEDQLVLSLNSKPANGIYFIRLVDFEETKQTKIIVY